MAVPRGLSKGVSGHINDGVGQWDLNPQDPKSCKGGLGSRGPVDETGPDVLFRLGWFQMISVGLGICGTKMAPIATAHSGYNGTSATAAQCMIDE